MASPAESSVLRYGKMVCLPRDRQCDYCGASQMKHGVTLLACGACKDTAYCNAKCQAAGWRAGHKEECRAVQSTRSRTYEMPGGRAQLSGAELIEEIDLWIQARRTPLCSLAMQASDIFPLKAGYNEAPMVPIVWLRAEAKGGYQIVDTLDCPMQLVHTLVGTGTTMGELNKRFAKTQGCRGVAWVIFAYQDIVKPHAFLLDGLIQESPIEKVKDWQAYLDKQLG